MGLVLLSGCACGRGVEKSFELGKDSFAFANELKWEYEFLPSGKAVTRRAEPAPSYALRCFPMVRAAREFFYHARFDPTLEALSPEKYRSLVRDIVHRNSRCPSPDSERITIPGFANLHEFSAACGKIIKEECGGAACSFLQRGNWRMVFPVTAHGQKKAAEQLLRELGETRLPIVHVYQFPNTTLNHAVLIYARREDQDAIHFVAYDPNDPTAPAVLTFDRDSRRFSLQRTRYFPGGEVKVYEVYRNALF